MAGASPGRARKQGGPTRGGSSTTGSATARAPGIGAAATTVGTLDRRSPAATEVAPTTWTGPPAAAASGAGSCSAATSTAGAGGAGAGAVTSLESVWTMHPDRASSAPKIRRRSPPPTSLRRTIRQRTSTPHLTSGTAREARPAVSCVMVDPSPFFAGKVSIVTGGGSGIGRALCERLGQARATVVVADVDAAAAETVAASVRNSGGAAEAVGVDVRDAAAMRELVERVARNRNRLDLMFNNAGIAVAGEVLDMTLADWDRTIDVNLRGVVHGLLPAYTIMQRQGSGHIVNTASAAGLAPTPGMTAYSASKHAVVGLSLSLRTEAEMYGVRVSVVCPGLIDTPMKHSIELRNLDRSALLDAIPVRMYPPEQCARDILHGVSRNLPVIVTPGHARLMVGAYRAFPSLVRWLTGREVRKARAAARTFSGS